MTRCARTGLSLGLLLSLAACASSTPNARPTPTASPRSVASQVSPGPAASEWIADIAASPSSGPLYVAAHSCPGEVAAGVCTIPSWSIVNGQHSFSPPKLKAYPLTMWRYEDGDWRELGQPGVFSYSDLMALPGGVVLVPRAEHPSGGATAIGPIRVSADAGQTWIDWSIPDQRLRCRPDVSPCTVVVAGTHVVVASAYGWIRRSLDDSDWADITPPKRAPLHEHDNLGYGVLGLDDGTLVATVNRFDPGPGGYYLVSKDGGSTWGGRHANPGTASQVDRTDGTALYATCWQVVSSSRGGTSGSGCGTYKSADLEHWTKASASDESVVCRRDVGATVTGWRETAKAVRIGQVVYAITMVPYVRGREATREDLDNLDVPHRAARVIERSEDGCRTWTELGH